MGNWCDRQVVVIVLLLRKALCYQASFELADAPIRISFNVIHKTELDKVPP